MTISAISTITHKCGDQQSYEWNPEFQTIVEYAALLNEVIETELCFNCWFKHGCSDYMPPEPDGTALV